MKNLSWISFFLFIVVHGYSQDTLVLKKGKSVICKVTEIGIDEIKYKDYFNQDGPVYVVRKLDVVKIKYHNGLTENILPDEMAMNKEEMVVDKSQCIKIAFLSPLFNHIQIGYEKKLQMAKNLEVKAGFYGIGNPIYSKLTQGTYGSAGIKFLLGQDFYIKGMRYVHPLKGSYIKPQINVAIMDNSATYYSYTPYPNYSSTSTNIRFRNTMLAFNMVYGKQFILGNIITFDMHIGFGYGHVFKQQLNNKSVKPGNDYDILTYYGDNLITSNKFPLSLTGGFNIGIIFK
jgi:hypothetical protein